MEISEILSPLTPEEFIARHWRGELFAGSGPPARFGTLLEWRALGEVLSRREWPESALRVFREGRPVPVRPPYDFEGLLRTGAVLVLSGADEFCSGLGRLAARFEFSFRERVSIHIYASYAGAEGLPPRWDDHDVFVIQVDGRKHWQVFQPTAEAPLEHGAEEVPPEEPSWEGELSSGGVLYVPRGFWHRARGVPDAPSLHLAVAVDRATGVDLVQWLAREVRESALFRRDLPRFADPETRRAAARDLAAALLSRLDDTVLERFLAADDAAAPARRLGGLTGGRWGMLRFLPPRPVELRVEEVLGRFIEFEALGRSWHVPRWTEAALRLLAERREISRAAAAELIPDPGPAVDYLIAIGLVEETHAPPEG